MAVKRPTVKSNAEGLAALQAFASGAHQRIDALFVENSALIRRSARFEAAVSDERTHRLKLADEQRAYVDARDRESRERIDAIRERIYAIEGRSVAGRGFFGRLKWLLRGR